MAADTNRAKCKNFTRPLDCGACVRAAWRDLLDVRLVPRGLLVRLLSKDLHERTAQPTTTRTRPQMVFDGLVRLTDPPGERLEFGHGEALVAPRRDNRSFVGIAWPGHCASLTTPRSSMHFRAAATKPSLAGLFPLGVFPSGQQSGGMCSRKRTIGVATVPPLAAVNNSQF